MQENKVVVSVKMFGSFVVRLNGEVIIPDGIRNTKSLFLLEYLILNRDKAISQEELIKVLQISDDSENQYNVLKNIVYRLRKMLETPLLKDFEWIYYKRNAYGLNDTVEYEVDADEFCQIANTLKMDDSLDESQTYDLCKRALELYKGELLPKQSGEMWVITQNVLYQDLFTQVLTKAYNMSVKNGNLSEVLEYLDKAVLMYPYEENLHALRIMALANLSRYDEATKTYNDVSMMLQNELGITPGEQLKAAYDAICKRVNDKAESIIDVKQIISEKDRESGAYFCNINAFVDTYHFAVRNFERTGQSMFLLLATLVHADGSYLERGAAMQKACSCFFDAARISMRRGDLFTRYSPSQFIILLTGSTQEGSEIVIKRIQKRFTSLIGARDIYVNCQIVSGVDVDAIISSADRVSKGMSWQEA